MAGDDGGKNPCAARDRIEGLMRIAVRTETELKGLAQTTIETRREWREENLILHKRISDHDEKYSRRLDEQGARLTDLEKHGEGQDSANRVRGGILAVGLSFAGGGLALLGQWWITSGRVP